jgi:hypothetical protein
LRKGEENGQICLLKKHSNLHSGVKLERLFIKESITLQKILSDSKGSRLRVKVVLTISRH